MEPLNILFIIYLVSVIACYYASLSDYEEAKKQGLIDNLYGDKHLVSLVMALMPGANTWYWTTWCFQHIKRWIIHKYCMYAANRVIKRATKGKFKTVEAFVENMKKEEGMEEK